jgi:hypothetical protein
MLYIGIDPGESGGVCILDKNGNVVSIEKCGDTELEMSNILKKYSRELCVGMLEKVHAFPGQGVVSVFSFGKNFGTWLGILSALEIPYYEVTPQKWMKYFGSMPKDKKDRKNHLKRMAQQRFPKEKITLITADAVMLAVYCYENELKSN